MQRSCRYRCACAMCSVSTAYWKILNVLRRGRSHSLGQIRGLSLDIRQTSCLPVCQCREQYPLLERFVGEPDVPVSELEVTDDPGSPSTDDEQVPTPSLDLVPPITRAGGPKQQQEEQNRQTKRMEFRLKLRNMIPLHLFEAVKRCPSMQLSPLLPEKGGTPLETFDTARQCP
jgi:hypothetical protein